VKNSERFAKDFLSGVADLMGRLPVDDVVRLLDALTEARQARRRIFLIGNGGSAATAAHMANDLLLGASKTGGLGLRAQALTDNVPMLTAAANDTSYDEVFAAQLSVLAEPRDLLIALSVSGTSPNIVRAIETAKRLGLLTVGVLGGDGGPCAELVDIAVVVPSHGYGPVESVHLVLDHLITRYLQQHQAGGAEVGLVDRSGR
jgi:D-sedoheptulose 7-phosphate isomerase